MARGITDAKIMASAAILDGRNLGWQRINAGRSGVFISFNDDRRRI